MAGRQARGHLRRGNAKRVNKNLRSLGRLTQENTRHKRRILRRNLRCGTLPDIEYACGAASWLCTKFALFWCEAVLPQQVRDKIDCKNSRILTYAGIFSGDFSRTGTGKTVCFLMSVGLLSGFVSFRGKLPYKKQIATAPMCRGSFVWGCPYRSLGCQSQSAKIMSPRSPVMNLFSIVHITLLSYSYFTFVLYAFGFYFASFNLDIFHSFLPFVFSMLHSTSCVFTGDTL